MPRLSDQALQTATNLSYDDPLAGIEGAGGTGSGRRYTWGLLSSVLGQGRAKAATAVGATTLSIDGAPKGAFVNGGWLVIDPFTTECEVRAWTGGSNTAPTFAALAYAHAADDPVLFLARPDIHAAWFGAGPGIAAATNTTGLQRALTAVNSLGARLLLAPGTYQVSAALTFGDQADIDGHGATLQAVGAMAYILGNTATTAPTTQQIGIRHLKFDGNSLATLGFLAYKLNRGNTMIEGLEAKNCTSHGMHFSVCQGGVFAALRSDYNGGSGILIEACNASLFLHPQCKHNDASGIKWVDSVDGSGGCTIVTPLVEQNATHGIEIDGLSSQSEIVGGWCERNTDDGINVANVNGGLEIHGLQISGVGTGLNRAIRLQSTVDLVHVHDNLLTQASGDSSYAAVEDESSNDNLIELNHNFTYWLERLHANEVLGTEILSNVDFEAGTAGWTGTSATLSQNLVTFHGGAASMKVDLSGVSGRADIAPNIVEAAIYKLTAWFYHPSSDPLDTGVRFRVDAGAGVINGPTDTTQDAWTQLTTYFVGRATGAATIGLQGVSASGNGAFYVDDVSLKMVHMPARVSYRILSGLQIWDSELVDGLNF